MCKFNLCIRLRILYQDSSPNIQVRQHCRIASPVQEDTTVLAMDWPPPPVSVRPAITVRTMRPSPPPHPQALCAPPTTSVLRGQLSQSPACLESFRQTWGCQCVVNVLLASTVTQLAMCQSSTTARHSTTAQKVSSSYMGFTVVLFFLLIRKYITFNFSDIVFAYKIFQYFFGTDKVNLSG